MSSFLATRRKLKLSRESSLSSSLSNTTTVIFFQLFCSNKSGTTMSHSIKSVSLLLYNVSRKKDKTGEYSLSTMSSSSALLGYVDTRMMGGGGGGGSTI